MRLWGRRGSVAAFGVSLAVSAGATLLVAACGQEGAQAVATGDARPRSSSTRALTAAAPVCQSTGAHDKHGVTGFSCAVCHECAGVMQFSSTYKLPTSGATISGGQIVRNADGTTTCSVACHALGGTSAGQVSWSATGPLACNSCHGEGIVATTYPTRSMHGLDAPSTDGRSGCQGCHDTSRHVSGTVVINGVGPLAPGNAGQVDAACKQCHGGSSTVTIGGKTAPLLVGWDSTTGDFHGSRSGTGFGGTLVGWSRGAAPIPCTTCHAPHGGTNAFLFASDVNAAARPGSVPDGTIARSGAGAENLCSRCHDGNRHAGCQTSGCHTSDPVPGGQNKPCFFCHGHEGIVNFKLPTWDNHPSGSGDYCQHCHSQGWFPTALDVTAPTVSNVRATVTTATTATVAWDTNEPATSYVEFGPATGAPSMVRGSYTLVSTGCGPGVAAPCRQVALDGLAPLTTYVYRVRSSDAQRNVSVSPTYTFTTPDPHTPPPPSLVPLDQFAGAVEYPATTATVTFQWTAVADPDGDPVQYQLQVSPTATFPPLSDTAWISATSAARTLNAPAYPGQTYSWRVFARDPQNHVSQPSPVGTVQVWYYLPWY